MSAEKDKAAEELIRRHFELDQEKSRILRFLSRKEDGADEPIKLLEVTGGTIDTGDVQTFGFGPAKDFRFSTVVAEVTPTEFRKIKQKHIHLPKGWNLERVREYKREDFFAASSAN